jgi:Tol biopolymer transport system component
VLNGPGEDTNPEIFPDGARVIYAHRQTQWILTLKDIGSGKVTELRSSVTDMFFPSFSPQGDKIAFFATVAGGDIHLFTIRIDGKELTQVTRGKGERNVFPSWSEDGMTLFFYQVRPALSFRRISASGGVSVGVADGWRWRTHNGAQVAPSGKHVIYSRLKKGETTTTLIREIESGKETVFSEALDTPRWSKDSKSILAVDAKSVHSVSEGGDVVICGLDNGLCRKIAERGASPLWSDSSRIYFDRWKSRDSREVWTVSSKGTDEQPAIELQQMDPMASSYDISSAGQVTFIQIKRSQQALWATSLK